LQAREAPDSKPGDEEILIRVRAAGVNPLDWKIRQGQLRLFLRLRFPYVLGSDIAGEVVSTGILAKRFKPGGPGVRLQRSQACGSPRRTRGREPGCGRP
jgi:NADPH:quinone reductase-like Zn-dependent oxidoreductase